MDLIDWNSYVYIWIPLASKLPHSVKLQLRQPLIFVILICHVFICWSCVNIWPQPVLEMPYMALACITIKLPTLSASIAVVTPHTAMMINRCDKLNARICIRLLMVKRRKETMISDGGRRVYHQFHVKYRRVKWMEWNGTCTCTCTSLLIILPFFFICSL